ncbi:maltokinase N-terminal cap-like domain-containing protein [Paeniglutamicibacter kerguelensis]|uniref:Maltokinase N-terminal cap domain-containing protein n=1 Tax=Paeniglutamicibacter kerguelensis TaxID=254788 RepID=A0ABS4X949_9MICC|nr:hypothetical protein [Paeniglutamicibacter kerguelensis]MBP2384995.1 hypothetical protein [Paeniglutamicibacter kerguelensis]
MSVIHETTMVPTKRELMAGWLPKQDWFEGGGTPVLSVAGGFRLDDPAGEVGLEMILVRDSGQGNPVLYHVSLSYRGAELAGAEEYLLGTSEHGVLGTRWIYDAAGDPVWQRQMRALISGEVPAQHQNDSNALDATVAVVLAPQADGPGDVQTDVRGEVPQPALAVIRRPEAGGSGSGGACAWVNASWADAEGNIVAGAVVELS